MPLIAIDVEETDIGSVGRIIQFETSAIRRVIQTGKEDQGAEKSFANTRQASDKTQKTIEKETKIRESVIETKIAQGQQVSILNEEQFAEETNGEQLKQEEDNHGQEKLRDEFEDNQRTEDVARENVKDRDE